MKKILSNTLWRINLITLLIIFIPLLLNVIWFRSGNIMGFAESGLPFYNFHYAYESNKDTWAHYALGFPTNISISAKPTYWLMAYLQNIGIPGFMLQAILFWLVLVVSGLSIFYLTKLFFSSLNRKFLLLAVLFYWFNPFTMVNVWNRFLNNFFVFYAFLPFALLIFLKGIQSKKNIYIYFFAIASIFFSYSFSSIAFVSLLWLILLFTSIFYISTARKKTEKIFIIKFFICTFLVWFVVNIWWLGQAFSYVYSGSFSEVEETSFSSINNQKILTILSQKLGNIMQIIRFQHGTFFSKQNELLWARIYIYPPVAMISFILPVIILIPLVLARKVFSVIFLTGLFLFGLFLAKGNNPPLGDVLNLFFPKLSFLQAFRNSFEKFGFILPLTGAPLFAYGVNLISEKIGKKKGEYLYICVLTWCLVVWGVPHFTGLVFTNNEIPTNNPNIGYQVKVPKSYKEASEWLNNETEDIRLLALPLGGEGMTYSWEKGYTGVELSNQLLPKSSISFQTNIPFYEDISRDLEKTFLQQQDITKVLGLLDIKYIMLRDDIDWHARNLRDPKLIQNNLKVREKENELSEKKNFGNLSFWLNNNWVDKKIFTSTDIVHVSSHPKISDSYYLASNSSVMVGDKINISNLNTSKIVVHPNTKITLQDDLDKTYGGGQDIFPHANFLPSSKFYPIIRFKEKIELWFALDTKKRIEIVIQQLGKRLVEAQRESDKGNIKGVVIAAKEYNKLLNELDVDLHKNLLLKLKEDKQIENQEKIYKTLVKHKYLITEIKNHFPKDDPIWADLENLQQLIDSKMISGLIEPLFGFKSTDDFPINRRLVYEFDIPESGEYELFWGNRDSVNYYADDEKNILQVDDQLVPVKLFFKDSDAKPLIKINFTKGLHEIAINTPKQVNLLDTPSEFNMKVAHGETKESFNIKNYDPYAKYDLNFDYWIKKGLGLEVTIVSNNASLKMGQAIPEYLQFLGPDNYDFDLKHFSNPFMLNGSANSASLFFRIKPWNDCESIFKIKHKERCFNMDFRKSYDRDTEVLIKNISITRILTDEPVLIKINNTNEGAPPNVSYQKIDNTHYIVSVKENRDPYILVLSELFDPGWRVFNSEGKELSEKHFLVNSYANGWAINQKGDYQISVKYMPQNLLVPTEYISTGMIIVLLILIGRYFWREYEKNN
jgi:hypothetical protein